MKRIILEGWNGYRRDVLPPTAGPVQLDETRRAFYAGVGWLYGSIMRLLEPGQDATANDVQLLADINRELGDFLEEMKRK
jgi:hypothetical protein